MPTPRQRKFMPTIARLHKLGIDAFREKTFYLLHLLRKPPEDVGVDHRHACKACLRDDEDDRLHRLPGTNVRMVCPLHDEKQRSFSAADRLDPRLETEEFLQTSGVRRAAQNCKSRAGGARRNRTDDLLLAKQALSQLSYGPGSVRGQSRARGKLVGLGRFELPTSRLSSARSNQLSYKPRSSDRPPMTFRGQGPVKA